MVKKEKTKNPKIYDSPTTPNLKVDLSNFITELVIIESAKKAGQRLVPKFWQLESWKEIYGFEVQAARNLLRVFPKHQELILRLVIHKQLNTFYYPKARFVVKKAIERKVTSDEAPEKKQPTNVDGLKTRSKTKIKNIFSELD